MLSIPYGHDDDLRGEVMARQIGITHGMGVFFTLMAVGMAISRIFSAVRSIRGA